MLTIEALRCYFESLEAENEAKTEDEMQVTKDTIIEEVLKAHPNAIQVLMKHNMGCVACMGATQESLEQGARMHGIDPEPLVKELNELFGEQKSE